MANDQWSWREAMRDLAFAIFAVLAAYVIFKYGGIRYASEGVWPPPSEYTDGR